MIDQNDEFYSSYHKMNKAITEKERECINEHRLMLYTLSKSLSELDLPTRYSNILKVLQKMIEKIPLLRGKEHED